MLSLILLLCSSALAVQSGSGPAEIPINTPYVETPHELVTTMLKVAGVGKNDVVYDLGSGDGRIVIAAARDFGARAVGIELNGDRVRASQKSALDAGVAGRVEFREQDLFDADISRATVVTLYLLPYVNAKLLPKLLAELRPGARIVSHTYAMGNWKPARIIEASGTKVYFWVVPDRKP